jgi:hypothetical protein
MRRLLYGFLVGALLSAMHAPRGLDLLQVPAVDSSTAYGLRAAALLILGLVAVASPRTLRADRLPGGLLAASAVGFLAHGLLLPPGLAPESLVGIFALLALLTVLIFLVERSNPTQPLPRVPDEENLGKRDLTVLVLAGMGCALALEGLARHLFLLGAGLPLDRTLFGGVFLILVAFGAVAFGGFLLNLRLARYSHGLVCTCLALTAAATLVGFQALGGLRSTRGLDQFLRRFGLDTSLHGTLEYDVLLGAAVLVVPALLLGATLHVLGHRYRLGAMLFGGFLGLALVPFLLMSPDTTVGGLASVWSGQLLNHGILLCGAAAVLGILLSFRGHAAPARWTALVLTTGATALGLGLRIPALPITSPWKTVPVLPMAQWDTPEGLITVEVDPAGQAFATLNRRAITPPSGERAADLQRVDLSWLEAGLRPGAAILWIGQLDGPRVHRLMDLGATTIDRTAPWHRSMMALETYLLGGPDTVPGAIRTPAQARRLLGAGAYDLVIVPPVDGPAPVAPPPVSRKGAGSGRVPRVLWISADRQLEHLDLGEEVLLAGDGFESLCLGALTDVAPQEAAGQSAAGDPRSGWSPPTRLPAGEPSLGSPAWSRLRTRQDERRRHHRAANAGRLSRAAAGTPWDLLTSGLAEHFAAQRRSSPFDTAGQALELSPGLALLGQHVARGPVDSFSRGAWESLARLLVDKRAVETLYDLMEPVAVAWPGWEAVEVALARADLEMLAPEDAAVRLERVLARGIAVPGLLVIAALAQGQAGDHARSASLYGQALAAAPGNRHLRRERAMALVRAGDPSGPGAVRELLLEDPDDPALMAFLEPGPHPPVPLGPPSPPHGEQE